MDNRFYDVEKKLVEENLDVVKIVILTGFRYDNNAIGMSFEDLYQVGCLALCEAVRKYDNSTQFKTFASMVIRSKLLTYCKKTNSINKKQSYFELLEVEDKVGRSISTYEDDVLKALGKAKTNLSGVALKGITALELKVKGFSGKEIADMYDTTSNNVNAWISRARKKLIGNKNFLNEISHLHTVE